MPAHNDGAAENGRANNQRPTRRLKPVACVVVPGSVVISENKAAWFTDARWWLAGAVILYLWQRK